MGRKHGFDRPYETIQIATWILYAVLNLLFYGVNCTCQIFYRGELQSVVLVVVLAVIYSCFSVATFISTWRCTAKDTSDPATMIIPIKNEGSDEKDVTNNKKRNAGAFGRNTSLENAPQNDEKDRGVQPQALQEKNDNGVLPQSKRKATAPSISPADEYKSRSSAGRYCHYCKTQTDLSSKHCRSCDRCTIGFDHHCRFINNCVGSRNYSSFLKAVIFCFFWLSFQVGVTLWILTYNDPEWLKVLAIIEIILALFPWFPIAHLLVFHLILLHKGISTYSWLLSQRQSNQKKEIDTFLTWCRQCKICKICSKVKQRLEILTNPPTFKIKKGLDKKYSITKVPDTLVIAVQEKKDHFECCRSPNRTVKPENSMTFECKVKSKLDVDDRSNGRQMILGN